MEHWAKGHQKMCTAGASERVAIAEREAAPKEFLCPITQDLMEDPVEAADRIRVSENIIFFEYSYFASFQPGAIVKLV